MGIGTAREGCLVGEADGYCWWEWVEVETVCGIQWGEGWATAWGGLVMMGARRIENNVDADDWGALAGAGALRERRSGG